MSDHTVTLTDGGSMPLLGFGTWQIHGREAYDAVRVALDVGYRHIDTATLYRNEAEIGRALRDSGVAREDVFLTTKLHPNDVGREDQVLKASLAALGTDYLDLWLVHWPPRGRASVARGGASSTRTPGSARAIGVSNYSTAQIDELVDATGVTPAVNRSGGRRSSTTTVESTSCGPAAWCWRGTARSGPATSVTPCSSASPRRRQRRRSCCGGTSTTGSW